MGPHNAYTELGARMKWYCKRCGVMANSRGMELIETLLLALGHARDEVTVARWGLKMEPFDPLDVTKILGESGARHPSRTPGKGDDEVGPPAPRPGA